MPIFKPVRLQVWQGEGDPTIILNANAIKGLSPETVMVDTQTLARVISMSKEWVIKNRARIIGAQKVGGRWRFNLNIIKNRLLQGKDIVPDVPRSDKRYKPPKK